MVPFAINRQNRFVAHQRKQEESSLQSPLARKEIGRPALSLRSASTRCYWSRPWRPALLSDLRFADFSGYQSIA
ncbi:hypothetical protein DMB90_15945 [Raoultella planticola]|uniref:Uncharacterized protein n=1 Tax=Raoultella planticola TaxID=575 RepID=A0A5P6AA71_RAOPL|nr:hypothetical protein DMB90_15945 [Raoultella planticola]